MILHLLLTRNKFWIVMHCRNVVDMFSQSFLIPSSLMSTSDGRGASLEKPIAVKVSTHRSAMIDLVLPFEIGFSALQSESSRQKNLLSKKCTLKRSYLENPRVHKTRVEVLPRPLELLVPPSLLVPRLLPQLRM